MMGATNQEWAIETVGLTKRFGKVYAVDHLKLQIPRGITYGLLGLNGAGKSTTIRMLMAMMRPTVGAARIMGQEVLADPVEIKQRVGYVPEMHYIYRWMKVREAIWFCKNIYRKWNEKKAQELIERFELDPAKKVKSLSKGMLTKLALLLAVAHEPEVLILDEPLSGLDALAREDFLDGVLRTICDQGQTVLISSHMLNDVRRLADMVGILHEGKMLVEGKTDDLLGQTKRIRAVLKEGGAGRVPEGVIWQQVQGREWVVTVRNFSEEALAIIKGNANVDSLKVEDLDLEELFKDYVRGRKGDK